MVDLERCGVLPVSSREVVERENGEEKEEEEEEARARRRLFGGSSPRRSPRRRQSIQLKILKNQRYSILASCCMIMEMCRPIRQNIC